MLFSRTAKYGIKALAYLSKIPKGEYRTARVIAEEIEAPEEFLSKIFQRLVKEGLLYSQRGRGGGFRLSRDSKDISLLEIIEIIEGEEFFDNCLFDLKKCGENGSCPIHDQWKPIREKIVDLLRRNTLADIGED